MATVDPATLPAIWLSSASGWTDLTIEGFSLGEGLDGVYELTVNAATTPGGCSVERWTGAHVTVGVRNRAGAFDFFNGYVDLTRSGTGECTLEIVSSLAMLRYSAGFAVHRNVSPVDAISATLRRHPSVQFDLRIAAPWPADELWVQYRETDANFVERLIEHIGASVLIESTATSHTIVITDQPSRAGGAVPTFEVGGASAESAISQWSGYRRMAPTNYALRDLTNAAPFSRVEGQAAVGRSASEGEVRLISDAFDGCEHQSFISTCATIRLEEQRAITSAYSGQTESNLLVPGMRFRVLDEDGSSGDFVVIARRMAVGIHSPPGSTARLIYALPADITYRPRRATGQPVANTEPAVVVAPPASAPAAESARNAYVRFIWQRPTEAAIPVRVLGASAIATIPPVGAEVLVDFIAGNPNRPVIGARPAALPVAP